MTSLKKITKAKQDYNKKYGVEPTLIFINNKFSVELIEENPSRTFNTLFGLKCEIIEDMQEEFVLLDELDIEKGKDDIHRAVDGYVTINRPKVVCRPSIPYSNTFDDEPFVDLKIPVSILELLKFDPKR